MKTKKLNLAQRLELAKSNLHSWQRIEALDLANGLNGDYERKHVKQFATYIKNTCEMHGLTFSTLLL